ncbi:MAG TPA: GNAT family N-acetyltransferase [Terriglobales bacterium]|nr:GNAT family N-acetyltransferase [Terriglobales bacterium]
MLRKVVARSPAEMDCLRPVWDHLYHLGTPTLFQSFAWNRLSAAWFAGREEPYIVLVESDAGTALIPGAIADHGFTLLGEALFDYRDVLGQGDSSVLRQAWQEVAALKLPIFFAALRGEERRRAWEDFLPYPFVGAPCARTSDTSAQQLAAAHARIASRWRKLLRQGVEFRHEPRPAADLLRQIYRLKAAQAQANLFRDSARINFLVAAAQSEPASCDVYTLTQGATLVAALVTFRDGDTRRFYTIYYDHSWAHFSPGMVLLFEVTRLSLEEGLNCDYMTGEQPHKTRLATAHVPLFRVECSRQVWARVASLEEQPVPELAV